MFPFLPAPALFGFAALLGVLLAFRKALLAFQAALKTVFPQKQVTMASPPKTASRLIL